MPTLNFFQSSTKTTLQKGFVKIFRKRLSVVKILHDFVKKEEHDYHLTCKTGEILYVLKESIE
jgi:hypothetical protein